MNLIYVVYHSHLFLYFI